MRKCTLLGPIGDDPIELCPVLHLPFNHFLALDLIQESRFVGLFPRLTVRLLSIHVNLGPAFIQTGAELIQVVVLLIFDHRSFHLSLVLHLV